MAQRDFPGGIVGSLEGRVGRLGDGGHGSETAVLRALQMDQWRFPVEEKGVKRIVKKHSSGDGVRGGEERKEGFGKS